MTRGLAAAFVFAGGFVIMVLEVIGARFLARDFGSSFYVWISQIGVVLVALALGYYVGGALADRFRRASVLAVPLFLAGGFTFGIPTLSPPVVEAIVMRHPLDREIPLLWQKLDPVLGSTLVFFLPCFVLAVLSPYMVRLAAQRLEHVGRVSGMIFAASTAGSIGGVFVSGYILIDYMGIAGIFRLMGILILGLGAVSLLLDRALATGRRTENARVGA